MIRNCICSIRLILAANINDCLHSAGGHICKDLQADINYLSASLILRNRYFFLDLTVSKLNKSKVVFLKLIKTSLTTNGRGTFVGSGAVLHESYPEINTFGIFFR